MHIYDLMDGARLTELIRDGYINMVTSPDGRHQLYSYSRTAAYERVWTPETRQCRGLVTNTSGYVVCLPFTKFFNAGEIPETAPDVIAALGPGFEATEKADGSLICVWYDEEAERWVATGRTSFAQNYVLAAQAWLDARADWSDWPTPERYPEYRFAFLCEWQSPDQPIVLRHTKSELRLIGVKIWYPGYGQPSVIDMEHWKVESWANELGLPVVPLVKATLPELVDRQQTDSGVEGWVLRWPNGFRVKVKTADYARLHRALSGFGPKQVYEAALACLDDPSSLDSYLAGLPEEIRPDALQYLNRMLDAVNERQLRLRAGYEQMGMVLASGRGNFARLVVETYPPADRAVIFAMADGKEVAPYLWKQLDYKTLFGPETEPVTDLDA